MIRKLFLPGLALLGMIFAAWTVVQGQKQAASAPPVAMPAQSPYDHFVAGAGLVEPNTQDIDLGTPVPGLVQQVLVKVGAKVKAGDPLFQLDTRDLEAQLHVQQAQLEIAQQKFAKAQTSPRPEDIPPLEARVRQAQATLNDAKTKLARYERIAESSAISADELISQRYLTQAGEAALDDADAQLKLMQAGTWKPDLAIAKAEASSAQASVASVQTEIDRHIIRAPVDGTILQVNIRPGEYAQAGVLQTPLMIMGGTEPLHIRVDIDENDAWRLKANAKAVAYVRGNKQLNTPLTFVRIEPYVIPKHSLTGDSNERIDTRVLQVIYSFDPEKLPVYVGQQMDIFIDAPSINGQLTDAQRSADKN